jgi:Pentapeptide repeats (8 copies)
MRLDLRTKRPMPWAHSKKSIKHAWTTPFMAVEWLCEWIAYFLSNWTFLQILDYIRGFSVIVIVLFYFYDSGNRVKQRHYQARQVINTAQGKGGNGGRIEALEELNEDHVSLVGVDVSGAFLQGLHLEKADLARAILNAADVRNAIVVSSEPRDADLRFSNFRECDCVRTSFRGAMLDEADFWGADLSRVDLTDASLVNTDLRNTNLLGIKWTGIKTLKMTDIAGARNAPDGFVAWALRNGAVRSSSDSE